MNNPQSRIVMGFVIAPLFGPIAALIFMVIFGGNSGYQFGLQSFIRELPGILFLFLLFGAPIAYLITGLVGIPLFLLFRKCNIVNTWSILIGSIIVPVLPILMLHLYHGYIYENPTKPASDLYLFLSVCGLVVGVVFLAISGIGNNEYNNSSGSAATKDVSSV